MYLFTEKDFEKWMHQENIREYILEKVREYEKEKTETDKKHDKIFKTILSNRKEAVRFINKKFKLEIHPEEIECCEKELISKGARVYEADIIYRYKNKKIYFLIEHQTKDDYRMNFRVLNYQIEIMRTCESKERGEKQGLVLAIVIHTGTDKWKTSKYLSETQEDIENGIKKVLGNIKTIGNYELEDINNYTKEELLGSDSLLDKTMYLEKLKDTKGFIEGAEKVFKRIEKKDEEIMSDVVRIALSGNMTNEKIEKTIEELRKIKRKGGKGMLAVKERIDAEFRSYREKGIKEGRKKGVQEGKCEIARNLLNMGYSVKEIREITKLSEKTLNKLKNKKN